MTRETHREHAVERAEEDGDVALDAVRDEERKAGHTVRERRLDDDRERAGVAHDAVTAALRVARGFESAPEVHEPAADHARRDDVERDGRGVVRDPKLRRRPDEEVCVGLPGRVQLDDAKSYSIRVASGTAGKER